MTGIRRGPLGRRPLWKLFFALTALIAIWIAGASLWVVLATRGRTYSNVDALPPRRVGLVLGCSRVLPDGSRNAFFDTRMAAAAEIFRAHKVDYLVVSGDNHITTYDEPRDMKDALVNLGVPEDHIFCDYAGFRTLDSIVRAREIFGQTRITVISQEFHNQRAIFIALHRGVDAIGFNAPEVDAYNSFKTKCRELVARANMLVDLFVLRRQPKFLGQKVYIPSNS
jgi:SanA protein